ncbi:elongation factor 1-alpha [Ziziphus jujuba]|nr:elongation factor 1-alpha [Ziziphus jujuba]
MGNEKAKIYILVMGHVNSSKSQVLDNLMAEWERGITTDNAMRELETDKYHFTFIDAYGHPDFIKDILTGHCWADCALLIVHSTSTGEFDEQARLHALLAYTLGIKQMICCFNKMDANTPNYSWKSYDGVLKSMSPYLKKLGYDPVKIPFVPIPGLEGDNLTEGSMNLHWYKGPSLLEALDQIQVPNGGKSIKSAVMKISKKCWAAMVNGVKKFGSPCLNAIVVAVVQLAAALAN